MPNYTVTIDGKPHTIELAKEGDNAYRIKIDNQTVKVVSDNDRSESQNPFTINIDGKHYRIELGKIEWNKDFAIKVEEATFTAELKTQTKRQSLTTFEPVATVGAKRAAPVKNQRTVQGAVTAPMTGKVMAVKVKKGEQVNEKQVLCIVEAMKMENEITAPKAGKVEEVNVSEGAAVNEGEVLFVIA